MSTVTASTSTIEETIRAYFTAVDDADPAAAVALFTPDARVMPDEMPTITGAAALQAVLEGYFQVVRLHPERLDIDRVDQHDGYAIVESHSVETITTLADQACNTVTLRELFVLLGSDTGWCIAEYMFNRVPPAAGS